MIGMLLLTIAVRRGRETSYLVQWDEPEDGIQRDVYLDRFFGPDESLALMG